MCVCKKLVFQTKEFELDQRPLALRTISLNSTDKPTYRKIVLSAVRPFPITGAQQHTLTGDMKVHFNATSIHRAAHAPCTKMCANVGKERNVIKGEEVTVSNKH